MGKKHSQEEVLQQMREGTLGTLGTVDQGSNELRMRMMYYGIDDRFTLYLLSTKDSPKIDQILQSPHVTFLVFNLEAPFDQSWEAEVHGNARLIVDQDGIMAGLESLKNHNPFAEVALASGITSHFSLIALEPVMIRFRIYGEALQGHEPTILEFS